MELRRDYFLDRWVIVGTGRKKRPHQFMQEKDKATNAVDVFAPGNESMTPAETGRLGSPWRIRWFPNLFPFLQPKGSAKLKKSGHLTSASPYGYHEIIVETPDKRQLWDFSEKEIAELVEVYFDRIRKLERKRGINYVQIFKNHGRKAGTSIVHSHTQVAATAVIPPVVCAEADAARKNGKGCYQKVIASEMRSPRRCFGTARVSAFAPFASRFNFEVWVFPKRHVARPERLSGTEIKELASVLKKILVKLRGINAPYNMSLHYAPRGRELHLHFEITPRLQNWAGYEFSSGIVINEVAPEDAARFYRGRA